MRQTKLVMPAAAPTYMARARLDARARDILSGPATIVRAGGGYGKTTLMRAWAEALAPSARVAWLALEPGDASATALLEALSAAFANAFRTTGGVSHLLERGEERIERLVTALSNDLLAWTEEQDRDVVLFADDVQFVVDDPNTLAALGSLVASLPSRAHMVLATRVPLKFSPLAKLRSAGRLLELDQSELSFTSEETAALVGSNASELFLDRTDGWPIAIGLLAKLSDRDPMKANLAFAESRESVFEFLADEVLARLPASLQSSLQALAVPDSIDDDVARDYLGVQSAAVVVSDLERYGLYFTLTGDGSWRLHALFREYLLERMAIADPGRLKELRVRCASMLRRQGQKMAALDLILEAEAYDEIVEYAIDTVISIRFTDRFRQFIRLMERIPDAVFQKKPALHRFYAIALRRDGRTEEALAQFQICYERALTGGNAPLAYVAQIELGISVDDFFSLLRREYLRSERHFLRALELAESAELREKPKAKLDAHWHLAMVDACRSRFDQAMQHFEIAERIELQSDVHNESVLIEFAEVLGWRGLWQRALEKAELAEDLLHKGGGGMYVGRALLAQARALHALSNDLPRALQIAKAAIEHLIAGDQREELAAAYALCAQCALAQSPGDLLEAQRSIVEARTSLAQHPNRSHEFQVAFAEFTVADFIDDADEKERAVRTLRRLATANDDSWQQAIVLYAEGTRLIVSTPVRANSAFALAAQRFADAGDAYWQARSQIGIIVARLHEGNLDAASFDAFITALIDSGFVSGLRSAPEYASALLAFAITNGASNEIIGLLAEASQTRPDRIRDMARDEVVAPEHRAVALSLLARADPRAAREIALLLRSSRDQLLADASQATLLALPGEAVRELAVNVVGPLQVHFGEETVYETDTRWTRRRSIELLRLLAIHDAPMTRDAVVSALWPENPTAPDTTFRVTLHLLRRALQPDVEGSGDYITYDGAVLRLRPDVFVGTDAARAMRAFRDATLAHERHDLSRAREAAELAVTVFEKAPREDSVADWLRPHVRSWRDHALKALHLCARIAQDSGDRVKQLEYVERAYQIDPLDEESAIALMDAMIGSGRHDSAKRVYETYRRRLQEQLGVAPGPAVVERFTRLLARPAAEATNGLSEREREVVALIAQGCSNKEIAARLDLSVWTVNNHVAKILKKLNVQSRAAAVAAAGAMVDG